MTNLNQRNGVYSKVILLTIIFLLGVAHLVDVVNKGEFLLKATLIVRDDAPLYFWAAISFYFIGLICILKLLMSYVKRSSG